MAVAFNLTAVAHALRAQVAWEKHAPSQIEAALNSVAPRGFLHKEIHAALPIKHQRFNLLGPVGPACKNLEVFGGSGLQKRYRDLESKRACGLSTVEAPCWVVSVGNANRWEFENAVHASTPCHIAVYDCTVALSVVVPMKLRDRVSLHRVCLGETHVPKKSIAFEVLNVSLSGRMSYSKADSQMEFVNYSMLLERGGVLKPPVLLKMDIEGFEWQVLPSLLASGALAPEQIAMELHYQTQMKQLSWFGRYKSDAEMLALGMLIRRSGYLIAHRADNLVCKWCTELLLVRIPAVALSRR
mmetsp:Transcript_27085/g.45026  ORF Transcript_27085/g.45026 Transcript_27085/m.45026 type:complete len:299 (+) Transcript_27085:65-961(+)|eukprot:CAMPEP_0119302468 /NCGR_PEP_ID=MMETSP1333-20130426/4053_1 /TAXON_ID=418940 /ORGANISM="Scyphosphaera apsteinii, Strain RCC1455" /LENGTH=298 /DNA_ID=CAMNT_0007304821 /DNA_START=82 /DNA_END=978 /DNA_ORIENTATION=+